jgi:hypothetical protein
MSNAQPQDPYGQQVQPGQPDYGQHYPQQGYQYAQPGYDPQYSGGYPPPPRKPLDLATIVTIGAWVVLGLYGLWFVYSLTQDDFDDEFADRFFGNMATLAQGVFYTGVLLAVGVWLRKQQAAD